MVEDIIEASKDIVFSQGRVGNEDSSDSSFTYYESEKSESDEYSHCSSEDMDDFIVDDSSEEIDDDEYVPE